MSVGGGSCMRPRPVVARAVVLLALAVVVLGRRMLDCDACEHLEDTEYLQVRVSQPLLPIRFPSPFFGLVSSM